MFNKNKLYFTQKTLKAILIYVSFFMILFNTASPLVSALSERQKQLMDLGILYYDPDTGSECTPMPNDGPTSDTPVNNASSDLNFPKNLSDQAIATGIETFIKQGGWGASPVLNAVTKAIASAKHANINPFLVISIAAKESQLGVVEKLQDSWNVRNANNMFGRTAVSSQPNIPMPNGGGYWYKWPSIEASLDYTHPANKDVNGGGDIFSYMRDRYGSTLDKGDMTDLMNAYAPPSDPRNDTPGYIRDNLANIQKMTNFAKRQSTSNDGTTPQESTQENQASTLCCEESSTSTTPGNTNPEKVWNYLTGTMGLNDIQAAGVMGNIQQESNFSTTALNPSSGAYGLIQWLFGRKTALQAHAAAQQKPIDNIDLQLDFMKKELEGSYKTSVLDPIKSATNISTATRIWLEKFEVPCMPGPQCDPEMNVRLPFAQQWLSKFSNGTVSTDIGNQSSSCASQSEGSNSTQGDGKSTGQFAWPDNNRKDSLTSCFGQRWGRLHGGVDIGSKQGADVTAADGGKVEIASLQGGFGYAIVINHGNGLWTLYGHNSKLLVHVGDQVSKGQVIAKVGGTGTGGSLQYAPHIHFNVQKAGGANYNNVVDPLNYLPKEGRSASGTNCPSRF